MARTRGHLRAAVALALLLVPASLRAQSAPESAIKAAFLAKFGAYVAWPASAAAPPMTICVVGQDSFGRLIEDAVAGQSVGGQPIIVRPLPRIDSSSGCRVAYLTGSPVQTVEAALAALAGAPVLTVTDAEVGPARGIIHFELADRRVRFRIDQVQANVAKLVISSKLLALALSVRAKERA